MLISKMRMYMSNEIILKNGCLVFALILDPGPWTLD
jgi:hypothetical protein